MYNGEEIVKQAIEAIKKHSLVFVEDVIAYLPCSKPTFYEYFPSGSDELNSIKAELDKNKVVTKVKMRRKWEDGDNATTQLALYKLICTPEEREALSMQHIDHTNKGGKFEAARGVDLSKLSDAALREFIDAGLTDDNAE